MPLTIACASWVSFTALFSLFLARPLLRALAHSLARERARALSLARSLSHALSHARSLSPSLVLSVSDALTLSRSLPSSEFAFLIYCFIWDLRYHVCLGVLGLLVCCVCVCVCVCVRACVRACGLTEILKSQHISDFT
jgi:hypothetical protein